MGKSKDRMQIFDLIVNIGPIWILSVFWSMELKWYWFFVFLVLYVAEGVLVRFSLKSVTDRALNSPLGFWRKAAVFGIILCSCGVFAGLVNVLPFGSVGNFVLGFAATYVELALLTVWTARK